MELPHFMTAALLGLLIVSAMSALVGTYIVTRRMVFLGGGITHACFGGLGLGYFLGFSPEATAALFAVGSSLGTGWLARRKVRRDSAIAVIWSLGMAIGILFIFLTPGNVPELNSFLFGNVLTISTTDLIIFSAFTALLILFYSLFYRRIVAVSFDENFSSTRSLPVRFINFMMNIFVAIAIVLTIRMIGIMLLMSLLSLPQMTAEILSRRYLHIILYSFIVSCIGSLGGLCIAWFISVPASATIVLLLGAIYLTAYTFRFFQNRRPAPSPLP